MTRGRFKSLVLVLAVLAAPAALFPAEDGGAITFRKVFKSSYPEYTEIKVTPNGSGTWDVRQLDEESAPQPFQISRPLVQRIYALAEQLHYFQGVELDVHRRIANLGQKTFQYQKGSETHEVTFNYTINSAATELLAIFEGLARQATDLSDLQRVMRYDRLGVNKVLLRIEGDLNSRTLPEPESLVPTLDQLGADEHFMDIARQRARALAERIRERH